MKRKISYFNQYCSICFEWQSKGITPDNAPEDQLNTMCELKDKAIEQSGLTENELALIYMCRKFKIFKKVNIYAHKIKLL